MISVQLFLIFLSINIYQVSLEVLLKCVGVEVVGIGYLQKQTYQILQITWIYDHVYTILLFAKHYSALFIPLKLNYFDIKMSKPNVLQQP